MKKAYLLDTNVLLFDPRAVFKFGSDHVVIPIVVIEEIDRFKREMSELGRHARQFSRLIDKMRADGKLSQGVKLPNGGILSVEFTHESFPLLSDLPMEKADNRILALALSLKKEQPRREVIFVTKDANLRIKADALDIRAQDYDPESVQPEQLYKGALELLIDAEEIDTFYEEKKLSVTKEILQILEKKKNRDHFYPNQYVILRDRHQPHHSAMARYVHSLDALIPIVKATEGLWGVFPKNAEQTFALDALLNDDIKLVTLVGKAGTGKTLLAIAAGLVKTVDENIFQRLLVSRPVFPLGRDIGFLPGGVEEKLNPWMQPIYDNIDFLFGFSGSRKKGVGRGGQELMNQGLLQIEPLTYIRGRSIPQQFLIVDEAQNLTPHEIKTIITRVGINTKIVLTGDSYQIDNPYVDSANNGLVYVVERFKEQEIAAHMTFVKGERSELSELASNLL